MKKTILIILLFTQKIYAQNSTLDYIDKIKEISIIQSKESGIPVSIIMSQAIIESGSGTSVLATKANNHFGIKCSKSWTGRFLKKNDDKPMECFRAYDSLSDCFRDHSRILTTRERYKFLFSYPISDYKKWAYGLKKAGYATNPKYPQILIKSIEKFKLYQYDLVNQNENSSPPASGAAPVSPPAGASGAG